MGIDHGARLKQSSMLRVCKLVRPWKQPLGMEVKLLPPRKTVCSMERLAREGNAPASALLWRESEVSWERELRSRGSVPVSDCEAMLIEVTLLPLHPTPFQSQKLVPDQPDGVGLKASLSLDMTAASSAMAVPARVKKRRKRLQRECRVFRFSLEVAIQIWEKCVWLRLIITSNGTSLSIQFRRGWLNSKFIRISDQTSKKTMFAF